VHVVGGIAYRTSRAADPELVHAEPGTRFHLGCSDLGDTDLATVE
jgi:hypothetical protein